MRKRPKRIQTERLVLRPLEERDREAFTAMARDERVNATYMLPEIETEAQEQAFFDYMLEYSRNDERCILGICLKDGGIIGFINDCSILGDSVEVGYFIGASHWGRGYASEALGAVIKQLFCMGFNRVKAGFFEGNAASFRVMQKCGMEPTDGEETLEYKGRMHRCRFMEISREEKNDILKEA